MYIISSALARAFFTFKRAQKCNITNTSKRERERGRLGGGGGGGEEGQRSTECKMIQNQRSHHMNQPTRQRAVCFLDLYDVGHGTVPSSCDQEQAGSSHTAEKGSPAYLQQHKERSSDAAG